MTATPIPRTLALTIYGDLDVSVIARCRRAASRSRRSAKPESRRDEIYAFVREQLDAGRQAYVIYPLVEESEKVDLQGGDRDGGPPRAGGLPGVPRRRCCTAG